MRNLPFAPLTCLLSVKSRKVSVRRMSTFRSHYLCHHRHHQTLTTDNTFLSQFTIEPCQLAPTSGSISEDNSSISSYISPSLVQVQELKMVKTFSFLPLILLLSTVASLIEGIYLEQEAPSYHLKRSLCNTYGGCSSTKRSLRQQQLDPDRFDQFQQQVEGGNVNKRDKSNLYSKRIEEILADLFEYMQNNEKYRQGKYVIVVPKQPPQKSQIQGSLLSLISTNNRISPYMDAGLADLQELQILKRED